MEEQEEKYLFEEMPVPKAVATLAVPTIISQVVTMIYNLADTFFVGQLGDPAMVAAVSLVSPWFNLLTALGNLFGLGGSSLISRMLGIHDHKDIKYVAAFSIWGGGAFTLLFSLGTWLARRPLLGFWGPAPTPGPTPRATFCGWWRWAACPPWSAWHWAICCAARATPGRPWARGCSRPF